MMSDASFTPTPEMIDAVADWRQISLEQRTAQPIVPLLMSRFNVNAVQAVAIIKAANAQEARHAKAS